MFTGTCRNLETPWAEWDAFAPIVATWRSNELTHEGSLLVGSLILVSEL